MAAKNCAECGAELEPRSTSCPLCGTQRRESVKWTTAKKPTVPEDVEDYQADLRKLRAQLKKIRDEGAEAV
ncbi:MAG: hypothetical protein ACR2LG_09065 [Actinomycetota bacterium]